MNDQIRTQEATTTTAAHAPAFLLQNRGLSPATAAQLAETIEALTADGKGLLAMDESTTTCNTRFAKLGIPQTEDARRAYRELIVTTAGLNQYISGAILVDETMHQSTRGGVPFIEVLTNAGIVPGIKVDAGAKDFEGFPGEKITEGLDGLRARLADYARMGARFAKWRAVITLGPGIPSRACIEANVHALTRYASLCQEVGIVPIVEPEVLMDGSHSLERCFTVTEDLLHTLFMVLYKHRVVFEYLILKPNMVLPGNECPEQSSIEDVADATVTCLLRSVPAAVPCIAFLSGGQPNDLASARLNEMHRLYDSWMPWVLTFSYSRAIQQPALETWKGDDAHVTQAQHELLHRAKCNSSARQGLYTEAIERERMVESAKV
jgi:fructose-bisphosphate aldolase, class I